VDLKVTRGNFDVVSCMLDGMLGGCFKNDLLNWWGLDVEYYNVYYADNLPCKPTFSGFLCAWPVIGIILVSMHVVSMGVGWGIHISKSNDMKLDEIILVMHELIMWEMSTHFKEREVKWGKGNFPPTPKNKEVEK